MKHETIGIETSATLVEIHLSVWSARRLDKEKSQEVISNAHAASRNAARVNKNLFAGRSELADIQAVASEARLMFYKWTLPWSDNGQRLLPARSFMDFTAEMSLIKGRFDTLVRDFVKIYPSLISAQAMALGDMFNADDFPTAQKIEQKFSFETAFIPVPRAGHFMVDIGHEALNDLRETLERDAAKRLDAAHEDLVGRLRECLERLTQRLKIEVSDGVEKAVVFRDSMVSTTMDLVHMTRQLNIKEDPAVYSACAALETAFHGVSADVLRTDFAKRESVRTTAEALLSQFQF